VPFLRVLRDKRGYETTYLMHWFRDGSRQRSRVLYVFRTPGGVRVGRSPLEPDVRRQIEARYPEIAFDWPAVRENQQVIEPPPEFRRRRPKREESSDAGEPRAAEPLPEAPPAAAAPPVAAAPPPASRPPMPSAIAGTTPDEQIAFLLEWYPLIRERIVARTADPIRRDALASLAERLNPATWTDADQITTGLQAAADALERLCRVLARRRRGARRKQSPSAHHPAAPALDTAGEPAEAQSDHSAPAPDQTVPDSNPVES
jgi:hypothetical protein